MPDWHALRYSQTKMVSKTTRRYSENWEAIFEKKRPEDCDLTPVQGPESKHTLTHTGKARFGHAQGYSR